MLYPTPELSHGASVLSPVLIVLLSGCGDAGPPPAPVEPVLPTNAPDGPETAGVGPRPGVEPDAADAAPRPGMGPSPGDPREQLMWLVPMMSTLGDQLSEDEKLQIVQQDILITMGAVSIAQRLDQQAAVLQQGLMADPPRLDPDGVEGLVVEEAALRGQLIDGLADGLDDLTAEQRLAFNDLTARRSLATSGGMLVASGTLSMRQLIHESGAERIPEMLTLIRLDSERLQALNEAIVAYESRIVALDMTAAAPGADLRAAYAPLDAALSQSLRARLDLALRLLALMPLEDRATLLLSMPFASYCALLIEGSTWTTRFTMVGQSLYSSEDPQTRPEMPPGEDPPMHLEPTTP
jgi:hypothetical protein